ncbi:MAG: SWIM zinc finger family protein [Anaerolineaceae bacterium]|nr:SWIM zinc finger family protein [Anaerolineaceae bacterium]
MDYGMISKLEKARRYSQERERFKFHAFTVTVDGNNNPHSVQYNNGIWTCDCDFYHSRGRCSHTMALEFILEGMIEIPEEV